MRPGVYYSQWKWLFSSKERKEPASSEEIYERYDYTDHRSDYIFDRP
jgi:hypothetical protein